MSNRVIDSTPKKDTSLSTTALKVTLITTVLIGFFLRVYHLNGQSYWEEELFSLEFYAKKTLYEIVSFNVQAGDPQPPLYYIVLQLWTRIAGFGEFPVRFVSLWFGVLTMPLMYQFGRRLYNDAIGAVTSLVAAFNPFLVWYAQEARTYSLTLFLNLMSSFLLATAVRSTRRVVLLPLYVVFGSLAIYSHYYSYLVIVSQSLWLLLLQLSSRTASDGPTHRTLRPLWLSQALLVLPYIPWLPQAIRIVGAFFGWHVPISTTEIIVRPVVALLVGDSLEEQLVWRFAPMLLSTVVIGTAYSIAAEINKRSTNQSIAERLWRPVFAPILLIFPLLAAAAFIKMTGRYVFHERYFIIIAPPLLTLLSTGIFSIAKMLEGRGNARRALLSYISLSILIAVYLSSSGKSLLNLYTDPRFQKADIRSAVTYIKSIRQDGDVIITTSPALDLVIGHYNRGALPLVKLDASDSPDFGQVESQLAAIARQSKRIWYFPYWESNLDRFVENWLDTHAYRVSHTWFAKARLLQFVTANLVPPTRKTVRYIMFNSAYRATEIASPSGPVQAGQVAPIEITWEISAPTENVRVVIDLVDRLGNQHSRAERPFPQRQNGKSSTEKYALVIPIGTPPGQYSVNLAVVKDGQNLAATDEQARKLGISVQLDNLIVARGASPSDDFLPKEKRLRVDFADTIALLGHDLPKVDISAGNPIKFSLFWQALTDIHMPLRPLAIVRAKNGTVVGSAEGQLFSELHPTTNWVRGEIVRDIRYISVSPQASTGTYDLVLLIEAPDGSRIGQEVLLGQIHVVARPRTFTLPHMSYPLDITFGQVATLRGYNLVTERSANETALTITLYWKAAATPRVNYKVFVHVLDKERRLIAQDDAQPAANTAPTSGWLPNEVIIDQHRILIPADELPSQLHIGLYEEASGIRVPIERGSGVVQDNAVVISLAN